VAPVGNDFVVTAGDLSFILKQIKIAERHSATQTPANLCGTLVGPGPDQIPDRLTSYGLRTVDGSCNNLFPDREHFAGADQPFPRLSTAKFRDAEPQFIDPDGPGPIAKGDPSSYKQKLSGNVVTDSEPRTISNLIVDQTSTNPAAIAAAGAPVRSQQNPGLHPCTTDPDPTANPPVDAVPAGCVPSNESLFIPNVTTDVGLSPPYNSLFTFFGQFFDHGVDQTVKSGGTVFVPLKADDPLRTLGPDGIKGTNCKSTDPALPPKNCDEVPASQAFMVLTRAQNQPGQDGILGTADDVQDANNTDSPWVDQSQTYTSHSSHQVFLRDYDMVPATATTPTHPISNGKFLDGIANDTTDFNDGNATTGSMSTWAAVKQQAAQKLGLRLVDRDVTNIPMLATDPYGNFIPGPARGLPQYVTATGLIEGNLASPVSVPANVKYFDTPFLTDIAHNADPSEQDLTGPGGQPDGVPDTFPTPDTDSVASADFAHQPVGTYDDEMLNDHFACGDGRCNENIALSTIHQVFHSEHNRLVDDITNTLNANPALLADYQAAHTFNGADISFGFGGRLFQAARFVTEMEYQHLVFEEFARKMVPAIRPFHVYSPDMNPAIEAEFAHAVYRFGHSMLDDEVARTTTVKADGTQGPAVDNSLPLLKAFLNPPEYFDNKLTPAATGYNPVYTPAQAAGAVVMGSSDQIGNELDEFVVKTLRSNLLGLPLDLPTLNMTRARDAGVPRLNEFRRDVFAQTNDGQLIPYTSWSDFGQHLKHPESLINFVAAYGQHPTIRDSGPDGVLGNADDVTTLKAKRDAARAIVDPNPILPGADKVLGTADDIPADVPPADAADFMFSTGTWASNADGVTVTGLDDVDLWVGGLAEVTNLFGGLLGSTFNYVFQTQLEKLQDGDRLYYLARTPGMNLRTQLEGNSFSEIIQRNTDGTNTLKADAFATADCKFQLANLKGTAADFTALGSVVADDPATDCDESLLLVRSPDGTISYKQRNTVDPTGINGQSVYNGTAGVDRIKGGNDNDTFWGGDGADVIDGQGGDDIALGGNGNDILTDLDGADVPKGGPGNDAIDAGPGDDIPMGNAGKDFINGAANDNESFAGPGDDFIIAGQGADAVFGDGGDDWIEGGSGQDLLQGDHGAPFFDDPAETAPGNDIFIGQVGENDYDTEGGDDIMAQNAAIDRNAGAGGFDWAIHQYDTVGGNDDLEINAQLAGLPLPIVVNRDRWQETEADSGSNFNDVIKGDALERIVGGFGFTGCDALDAAGVARISGLGDYVKTFPTPVADVKAVTAAANCPLTGVSTNAATGVTGGFTPNGCVPGTPPCDPVPGVWAEGNILFGGGGSDVIEGRENQDIIDGDNAVNVAIEVHANADGTGAVLGSTDLMENTATSGNFGAGTIGMTLQQAVFAGKVDPGQLVGARFIVKPDGSKILADPNNGLTADCPAATPDPATPVDGVVGSTVKLTTAKNCDTAVFSGEPTLGADGYTITPNANGSITVADKASAAALAAGTPFPKGDGIDTLWNVENLRFCIHNDPVLKTCDAFKDVSVAPAAAVTPSSLAFGNQGIGTTSTAQNITVTNTGVSNLVVSGVTLSGANPGSFTVNMAPGCSSVAGGASCTVAVRFAPTTVGAKSASVDIADNAAGSPHKVAVTGTGVAVAPSAPTIGTAVRGNASATVNWSPPASDGGAAITGFSVRVVNATTNAQVGALRPAPAGATSLLVTGLTNGTSYRFQVSATNSAGTSAFSALSNAVTPATVPGAPTIGNAANGANGGPITATANWTAPASNGGSAIINYQVIALRMSSNQANATVLGETTSVLLAQNVRTLNMPLPVVGNYRFQVVAINDVGTSLRSARSNPSVLGR